MTKTGVEGEEQGFIFRWKTLRPIFGSGRRLGRTPALLYPPGEQVNTVLKVKG